MTTKFNPVMTPYGNVSNIQYRSGEDPYEHFLKLAKDHIVTLLIDQRPAALIEAKKWAKTMAARSKQIGSVALTKATYQQEQCVKGGGGEELCLIQAKRYLPTQREIYYPQINMPDSNRNNIILHDESFPGYYYDRAIVLGSALPTEEQRQAWNRAASQLYMGRHGRI
jgi:hypothetical protein